MADSTLNYVGQTLHATPAPNAILDVIFVHGLGGDPFKTWTNGTDPTCYWPRWLAAEFPKANIWSAGYDSGLFANALAGEGGSLSDRSSILLELLMSYSLGSRRIIFIAHSLGGLIVKQMLRRCSDSSQEAHKKLLSATSGIIFIGTPHQGSDAVPTIRTLLKVLASKHVNELAFGEDRLFELNEWFRNWASSVQISVFAYYEIDKTYGSKIVNKVTANPCVFGCEPVAIDGNHIDMCKPATHEAPLYLSITAFLRTLLPAAGTLAPPTVSVPLLPAPVKHTGAGTALVPTTDSITAYVSAENNGMLLGLDGLTFTEAPPGPHPPVHEPGEMPALEPELLSDYQFFTTQAPVDRRPLSVKLEQAGRAYEVSEAERKKERFAKSLQRHSAQPSSLARYTRLMSEVETRFNRHIRPFIVAGASVADINRLVQDEVIDAALKSHMVETEDATASLVDSALYYLTGNCHVRWDADKD